MAAQADSILALTKSTPVPVGPGTRKRARTAKPSPTKPGFRAKKKVDLTMPTPKVMTKEELFPYYSFDYETTPPSDRVTKDGDRFITLYRNQWNARTKQYEAQEVRTPPTKYDDSWIDGFKNELVALEPAELREARILAEEVEERAKRLFPQSKRLQEDFINRKMPENPQYLSEKSKDIFSNLLGFPKVEKVEKAKKAKKPYDGPEYRTSGYMRKLIDPKLLKGRIDAVVAALQMDLDKFDSIAFTGMSGAMIGPPVALALGKEIIMVRKRGHHSHSDRTVEGNFGSRRYIILDDGRASGDTEKHIIQSISDSIPDAEYVGFMSAIYAESYEAHGRATGTALRELPIHKGGYGDML